MALLTILVIAILVTLDACPVFADGQPRQPQYHAALSAIDTPETTCASNSNTPDRVAEPADALLLKPCQIPEVPAGVPWRSVSPSSLQVTSNLCRYAELTFLSRTAVAEYFSPSGYTNSGSLVYEQALLADHPNRVFDLYQNSLKKCVHFSVRLPSDDGRSVLILQGSMKRISVTLHGARTIGSLVKLGIPVRALPSGKLFEAVGYTESVLIMKGNRLVLIGVAPSPGTPTARQILSLAKLAASNLSE